MAEKNLNTRIVNKHDTEANWIKATSFTPKPGELIVYDKDSTHNHGRLKVGDGSSNVNNLPFITDGCLMQSDMPSIVTEVIAALPVYDGDYEII